MALLGVEAGIRQDRHLVLEIGDDLVERIVSEIGYGGVVQEILGPALMCGKQPKQSGQFGNPRGRCG
jgi:hypothetical protein